MNPIYQEQKIILAPALCKDCEGVDTTFYLCPKCNRFTLEKWGCGLFD